jgi:hypothetical protein
MEAVGVIDLVKEIGFGSPDTQLGVNLPNGRRGFGCKDGDYIMTLNGHGGSVTLGFAPDTGMFIAILAPDRTHPQSEVLDALDMDDPSELAGLVSAIRNTLKMPSGLPIPAPPVPRPLRTVEDRGMKVFKEIKQLCKSGVEIRGDKLFIIGDPYEDPDLHVASTHPAHGVVLSSGTPIATAWLDARGVARAIVKAWSINTRHEIYRLANEW